MKALTPPQLAWLLPIALMIHQLEEYAGHFPAWYSKWMDARFSDSDFITINLPALLLVVLFASTYRSTRNNLLLLALGTLLFLNGTAHLLISVVSISYSPGTISGVLLFLPLGLVIFQTIGQKLNERERLLAVCLGIVLLLAVAFIARVL